MPSLSEMIPSSPRERTKFFVVLGVFAVVMIWLIYYLATNISIGGGSKPLDTPGWRTANSLTDTLNEHPNFKDVGFGVVTEKPLRLKLVGGVHNQRELDALLEHVKELRPEGDYDIEVEIIGG